MRWLFVVLMLWGTVALACGGGPPQPSDDCPQVCPPCPACPQPAPCDEGLMRRTCNRVACDPRWPMPVLKCQDVFGAPGRCGRGAGDSE
jgi:hypothetical protein